ncbi:hypothetical protein Tco_0146579 [Tanacetum coccineum]
MPPPVTNKPFTKPPTEQQLLAFIKRLGYDEDLKEMMTSITNFVATRLHQPWRAIMSVLNRCLTGKDTSWDRARLPVLQILWGIVHSANLDYAIHRRSDAEMHNEGQDSPISKLVNTVDGKFNFEIEIPDTMINDAIKQSAGYKFYRNKNDESEKEVNMSSKPKKDVVPKKPRTITVADNIVEQETVVVKLTKSISFKEQLQQRSKESRLESMKQERQVVGGKGSSVAKDKYYEFQEFSESDSDATRNSSWADTDEDKDDETDDAEDSDMDISDNDSNKVDADDADVFGVFVNKSQELPKFTSLSPVVTCSSMEDFIHHLNDPSERELTDLLSASEVSFGTNLDVQATDFVLQEMFADNADHHISSPPATTIHDLVTNPQQSCPSKIFNRNEEAVAYTYASAIAKFVKSRLNNIALEVMKNNQNNLYTTPSPTTTDDLSEMDLKLKLLNKMYKSKSFESHDTNYRLYDVLYESICLDQETLDAQDT